MPAVTHDMTIVREGQGVPAEVHVPVERGRGQAIMTFVPYDRPIRAAFIGLGRIYDLNTRA